jgi:S1-C subfamily serine protease
MKRVFLLLIALIGLFSTAAVSQATDLAQAIQLSQDEINRIASTVVYIETEEDGQPFASGSGTLITSTGLIFTNRHVIEDGDDFHIFLLEDMRELPVPRYYASLVHVFDDIDFAVLQIDRDDRGRDLDPEDLDLEFLEPTTDEVNYGESVYIFGYPDIGDGYLVLTQGSITTIENGEINGERLPVWYRTDAEMSSGNSGGLVINERGEFVGIPTWVRKADSTLGQLGGILPHPAIQAMLDTVGDEPTVDEGNNNDGDITIQIENDSRDAICFIYFSPTTSTEWGSNYLDDELAEGDAIEIQVDSGSYDLQLKDCDDDELDSAREINVEDDLDIIYSRSGIEYDAPEAPEVEQSLTLEIQDIEYDAPLEGEDDLGIMVYAYIRATGYKDVPLRVGLFYYWADGDPMSGENAIEDNNTPAGNLTVQAVITPEYDDTEWDGFWFWMPYEAFPDFRGDKEEAFVQVEMGVDDEDFIVSSDEEFFTLEQ